LEEFGVVKEKHLLLVDNVIYLSKNLIFLWISKHIDRRYQLIWYVLDVKLLVLAKNQTDNNEIDIMIKALKEISLNFVI